MTDMPLASLRRDDPAEAVLALYRQPPLDALEPPAFGAPEEPTLPMSALLERETLTALLDRFTAGFGEDADRRAVASLWSKFHLSAVSIPALVANLLLDLELPVAPDEMRLNVDDRGQTSRLWLPHGGWPLSSLAPEERFRRLFDAHCGPLIETLAGISGLSPKVFWSNLGHYVEYAGQTCNRHPDIAGAGEPLLRLLEIRTLADGRRNPLFRPVRYLDLGGEAPARVRRLCCIKYRLPEEALCGGCPLKPENLPAKRGR